MANKPRIYAQCKSGCEWETVHRDEFLQSASIIKLYEVPDGSSGRYEHTGSIYDRFKLRVIGSEAIEDARARAVLRVIGANGGILTSKQIEIPRVNDYMNYATFQILAIEQVTDNATWTHKVTYELNGELATSYMTISGAVSSYALVIENAWYIYLFNDDANIVLEGGGSGSGDTYSKTEIDAMFADLNYKAIQITSFTASPSTAEKGSIVDSVTFVWALNKTPTAQSIGDVNIALTERLYTLSGLSVQSNKSWTLSVADEKGVPATKSAGISFINGVYYGVAEEPEEYESAFILGLTKSVQTTRAKTIDVTAGAGEYIYYCVPSSYGECTFTDVASGFGAGLEKVKTINFTNAKGYMERYDIYKSEYDGLGKCSIKVS